MIYLIGGTHEGRMLCGWLEQQGLDYFMSVATELGRSTYQDAAKRMVVGRLDEADMSALMQAEKVDWVIDASHPHATEVSKTAIAVCKDQGIPYTRWLREPAMFANPPASSASQPVTEADSFEEAFERLAQTEGRILVTGSKELGKAIKYLDQSRLMARIVPNSESIAICEQLGLRSDQIIGLKGPFTDAMNQLIFKEWDIKHVIFKESGEGSGFEAKIRAASACGVNAIVVKMPKMEYPQTAETLPELEAILKNHDVNHAQQGTDRARLKTVFKHEKDGQHEKSENKNFGLMILGLLLVAAPSSASAMHIMEGYLPKGWAIFWFAAFLPFFLLGLRKLNRLMGKGKDIKLLLGLVAAFTFCLSALKIPSVVGSCSHPTGVGLGSILFGPLPMVVVGTVVLLLQALLLAHGGLTTLGANGFSMAVAGPLVTYGLFKTLTRLGVNKKWAIFAGAFLGDIVTYAVTSVQLGLAFPGTEGFAIAITKYLGIFMFTQLPIAIGEGILTVLVYNWIVENKDQLQLGEEVSL